MNLDDFIQLFAEQFDDTDVSEFTPKTVFHELEEYSSLIALSIIAMVNEEYDVIDCFKGLWYLYQHTGE